MVSNHSGETIEQTYLVIKDSSLTLLVGPFILCLKSIQCYSKTILNHIILVPIREDVTIHLYVISVHSLTYTYIYISLYIDMYGYVYICIYISMHAWSHYVYIFTHMSATPKPHYVTFVPQRNGRVNN